MLVTQPKRYEKKKYHKTKTTNDNILDYVDEWHDSLGKNRNIIMKTHIKSKKFYKEAENLQKGGGDYLRYIDKLKDQVSKDAELHIKDFCWTLYGDGHCSHTWQKFREHVEAKTKKHTRKYSTWTRVFRSWQKKNP